MGWHFDHDLEGTFAEQRDRQDVTAPRGARPNRPATTEALAEWETRTFSALRRRRDASTPVDDELPDDPLRDLAETKSALERMGRA